MTPLRRSRRAFLALSAAGLAGLSPVLRARASSAGGDGTASGAGGAFRGAHRFRFAALGAPEGEIRLADYAGRPVLVVNTASRCGFTSQYDALQALWDRYRADGLVVIGAPSRDFGRQEFEDEARIKDFCEVNFAIDFPMTELVRVKGSEAHPFYAWAAEAGRAHERDLPAPRWNFHKYLVAPDGRLAGAWDSSTPPDAPEIVEAVERLLPG